MYDFLPCTLIEINNIISSNNLEYVQLDDDVSNLYKIIDEDSITVAIIKFYSIDCIEWFEVLQQFRLNHIGTKIIKELLFSLKPNPLKVVPKDEEVEKFWRKCGFKPMPNNPPFFICSYD